jgi:inorganic phosphate transporter, PiT family
MTLLIVLAVLALAYSNGANDNFKGVATLFGCGATNYRRALTWATATTFAGSLLALLLAAGLVDTFKGRGLVPDAVVVEPAFVLAVSLGAALTVLLATWLGLPVSTTHALTGGLLGAGLLAAGAELRLSALGSSVILPLACAPVAAITLTGLTYPIFRYVRHYLGISSQSCVCLGTSYEPVAVRPDGTLALVRTGAVLDTGKLSECVQRYQGRMVGLDAGTSLDLVHFVSAGAVGFARGLNDTPKIVAMLLAVQLLAPHTGVAVVAAAMAIGGILSARRVAETMSRRITQMSPGQGLTANVATAFLVLVASRFGLPVSTTHVSVGSLFGIGMVNGTANPRTILTILLAWITTLPLGALLGGLIYLLLPLAA